MELQPVFMPMAISIIADLLEKNLHSLLDELSFVEQYELWCDRMNKKGFSYTKGSGKKQKTIQSYYFYY